MVIILMIFRWPLKLRSSLNQGKMADLAFIQAQLLQDEIHRNALLNITVCEVDSDSDIPQTSNNVKLIENKIDEKEDDDSDDSDSSDDEDLNQLDQIDNHSSSSEDSEDDIICSNNNVINKDGLDEWLLSEDEININTNTLPKTKNELDEVVETPHILHINPTTEKVLLIGSIISHIQSEYTIVIQGNHIHTASMKPLNEGSYLCLVNGQIIGKVHELFGPLTAPFYTVKYNNTTTHNNTPSRNKSSNNTNTDSEIVNSMNVEGDSADDNSKLLSIINTLTIGTPIYCIETMSEFIGPNHLKKDKGTDASNLYDEEVSYDTYTYAI